MPRAIWPAGPWSSGAGSASVTGAPVRAVATLPDGSDETTTIGTAPPDHAASAMRRTLGRPSAWATAPSAEADRITAATVMASRCYALGRRLVPTRRLHSAGDRATVDPGGIEGGTPEACAA